jgi:outer membrane protein assembly factor BamB
MRGRALFILFAALTAGLWLPAPASAVITALIPMSDIVEKEQFIFVAKVREILPDKPALVLVPAGNLKGEAPFERMPVSLAGDAEAKKGKHTDILLERIEKDLPIVVIATKRGGRYIAFGFTNGTWFSMDGRIENQEGKEVVRWSFLHCEPYLRRTFKGSTDEMKQVVTDAVAKKKEPPPPDEKEKPGYGEPIKKKSALPIEKSERDSARANPDGSNGVFPALGVIQLPFIGLIAGLAALFPTVFGGLALFMKRWVAALSISGLVSIFVTIPLLAPGWAGKQWFFSASGLWLSCAILFSLGALWSLRRYRKSFVKGIADAMQPRRFDRIFATLLFVAGLSALLVGAICSLPLGSNDSWRWVLAGTAGFGCADYLLMTSYLRIRNQSESGPLRIAPESVLLWVLATGCLTYGTFEAGKYSDKAIAIQKGGGGIGQPTLSDKLVWKFEPEGGGLVVNTCATPERVYAAVMVQEGLSGRLGRIYALDPETGSPVWEKPFDNDYDTDSEKGMKPAFSAPVYADGRIYFGEGMHTDKNSRLFCLNAETGKKLWDYQTDSHTESSPAVADGKVVIGAGYHGLHCVDVESGKLLWRYPKDASAEQRIAHVDCNPFIVNGRVYAGSGYKPQYLIDDKQKLNRIFCLDLNTGNEIWQERIEDSVYGSPLVAGDRVFFGTGNSTYSESIASKQSGVLCRDAATGKFVWDRRLPENVIGRPAADKRQLFVGCLDGNAYGLDLRSGEVNWTVPMGAKVLAGPVADLDPETGCATVVYFAGESGNLTAVSPYSGAVFWNVPVQYWSKQPVGVLSATPAMLKFEDGKILRHRLFIGFGQGRSGSTTPKLYCIEDTVKKTAD